MSDSKKLVGLRIKERRSALGLSQRDLAAVMGYSNHSTVARIEAGTVDLPQSKVAKFAEALQTTPAFLMGWDREPEDLADLAASILQDPKLLVMIEKFRSLAASDQKAVRAMVNALAAKND